MVSYSRLEKVGIWPGTNYMNYADFPSSLRFGVGEESYSKFLASTVGLCRVGLRVQQAY